MIAMRTSCKTPASISRVLKVCRKSWKRTWRTPPCLSAVFQVRCTKRIARPRKSITSPSGLRCSRKYSYRRAVSGISRDSPSGVFERVTKSVFWVKSISSQRWLVISPRRIPVSSAIIIMTRRCFVATPSSRFSSARLRTWRRVRRSRAIFSRVSGFWAMNCSSSAQLKTLRRTLKSRLIVASLIAGFA